MAGTSDGKSDVLAGTITASTTPVSADDVMVCPTCSWPTNATTDKASAIAAQRRLEPISSRRRSNRSAITPSMGSSTTVVIPRRGPPGRAVPSTRSCRTHANWSRSSAFTSRRSWQTSPSRAPRSPAAVARPTAAVALQTALWCSHPSRSILPAFLVGIPPLKRPRLSGR